MMDPSRKHSFEDQWKQAFDEASVTPPASAWEGIEARLGIDTETRGFENQWKQAFDEVTVIPPAFAWEAIEARLDQEQNNKILPLWRSAKLWYAAASVVALLLVGGGLWYRNHSPADINQNKIAVRETPAKSEETGVKKESAENVDKTDFKIAESQNEIEKNRIASAAGSESSGEAKGINKKATAEGTAAAGTKKNTYVAKNRKSGDQAETGTAKSEESNSEIPGTGDSPIASENKAVDNRNGTSGFEDKQAASAEIAGVKTVEKKNSEENTDAVSAQMLAGLPVKDLEVFVQKRYVFYKPEEEEVLPAIKKHTEYWAGVGLMPASFNPDVNITTPPSTFSSQSLSRQKSVIGKSEPGVSYALQTQGGMRISKHWSVETGVSYLQGNSSYGGGGYLLDVATNGASNVLETALADAYNTNKGAMNPSGPTVSPNNFASSSNLYIDVNKQVRNDYQYLQLPVQAGFTLNPEGKLSYSVLGGMMANFFLNNQLESANGDIFKTTVADDVYRSMTWAATTGLRFNYRVSSRWRATLTGSYQKSITSGVQPNQSLESHPYLYGVSWGMRYSF